MFATLLERVKKFDVLAVIENDPEHYVFVDSEWSSDQYCVSHNYNFTFENWPEKLDYMCQLTVNYFNHMKNINEEFRSELMNSFIVGGKRLANEYVANQMAKQFSDVFWVS